MADDHNPGGHGHDHMSGANAKMLGWALGLTSAYLVAEVVGGIMFNSLALLSDAAHMMTDVAALIIALLAIKVGSRPPDDKRTFGYRRFEILAAALNAVLLFAIAIYVLIEAIHRFRAPQEVQPLGMLVVAAIGLAVNFSAMRILAAGKQASFNVKGAYLEVWADMIGSAGVIAGAIVIRLTGWLWIDPAVAVAIALWVLPRTWTLLRDTINVLLEGVPHGLTLREIRASIASVPGVAGLHDLHVWSMTNDTLSGTVHVIIADHSDRDEVRRQVAAIFRDEWGIEHITVQTESVGTPCDDHMSHA